MNRQNMPYIFLLVVIFISLLAGCTLPRSGGTGDIDIPSSSFNPPPVESAQNGTVIRFQPETQQIKVNDIVVVELYIDNVANLFTADVQVQFNPAVIQVQDTDENKDGVQITPGNFLSADFVTKNNVDNVTGTVNISYDLTQVGIGSTVNGSGVLASATFIAMTNGDSQLLFNSASLVDGNNNPIAVISQPGQVTVGQVTQPGQPTNTPFVPTATTTPSFTATPIFTPTVEILPTTVATTTLSAPTPTPTVNSVAIPAEKTNGFCYRVQEGETLNSLAQRFGMDAQFISIVNALNPPGYIYPQQTLFIPLQHGNGPNVYTVKVGDTLQTVADNCYIPVAFLAQVNKIDQTLPLSVKELIIPRPPFPPPSRFSYPPFSAYPTR